ncbi:MAG: hypothetical protein WBA67_00800 [Jannaschia sp.]
MTFSIAFDYRFDSTGFFNDPQRRSALEHAAAIWEAILLDEFENIRVGTRLSVDDPSLSGVVREVVLTEEIDDLLIFVGAEALGGNTLAFGGYEGGGPVGDALHLRIAENFRGQGPATDFEPYVGTISYRIDGNFSYDIAGPVSGLTDFITVTLHEIGHVLGLGTAPIFDAIGLGGLFDGVNALVVSAGAGIPLESNLSHVAEGFGDDDVLMDPIITRGARLLPTTFDKALLADIGYRIDGLEAVGTPFALATEGADGTIFGGQLGDLIDGLGGSDQIQGGEGDDTLMGGAGNDTLFGQAGNDSLLGNDDSDQIQGGGGNDSLSGGAGDDSLFGQDDADLVDGGTGDDFISGGDGNDTLLGGFGSDRLNGDAGADLFRIVAGGGVATLQDFDLASEVIALVDSGFASAQAAADAITKEFSNVSRLVLGDGTHLRVFHGSQTGTPLTAAHFVLETDEPRPTEGDDILIGTAGPDRIDLLAGDDRFTGQAGNDTINGGAGADTIDGDEGQDSLHGGEANDLLRGGADDDSLNGWSGDDTLDGGAGADLIIGGQGSDVIHVDDTGDRVIESRKWAGIDTVISSVDFRAGSSHVENITLSGAARAAVGNGLSNVIRGNEVGNILDGGKNNDTLIGGPGNDTYLIRAPGDHVIEDLDGGVDAVRAFRAYAMDPNVERLYLQTMRDPTGEGVRGLNGIGNDLDNLIVGNVFDNIIVGRGGNDTLRGQGGADTFVFDRAIGEGNVDRILDFNTNEADEGDILKVKQMEFTGMEKGRVSADVFVAGLVALDADDRLIFDRASGRLWFDRDGNGPDLAELVVTFDRNALVTVADIEVF